MVHRTVILNIASICLTCPYCTIAIFTIKGIHIVSLLFVNKVWSKCLTWHFLYHVTGRFKHVLCGATSWELIWNLSYHRVCRVCFYIFVYLQTRMLKTIPESHSETTARKLGEILQASEAIQDAQALLLQAHQHADQLFNPWSTVQLVQTRT